MSSFHGENEMSDVIAPPNGCEWWKNGKSGLRLPEAEEFMRLLVEAGFHPYTAAGGLFGVECGLRRVQVLHRGRLTRWHIFFARDQKDEVGVHVVKLPSKANVAIDWLNGASLESVRAAIPDNEW